MTEEIAVNHIYKSFPGVQANNDVSLTVEHGEIRAIVGENGAGKTTLMNMLYGLYRPDAGKIYLRGEEVHVPNASVAIKLGIGMVHQHFKLVPSYTLAQNVVLGVESSKFLLTDEKRIKQNVAEISEKFGLPIDVDKPTLNASVGEQQRAEILKALYRGAEILILDEPTAVLTDMETEELFVMLKGLAKQGKTILFISHKLREVLAISDNTTVMRQGRVVGTVKTSETDDCQLAEMMVGRETVGGRMREMEVETGDVVLEIDHINVLDDRNLLALKDVSFELKKGEILGIAGVDGNGQEELSEAIMGMRPIIKGNISIKSRNISNDSTRKIRESGVAYIPSDRYKDGVAIDAVVWENMVAGDYYHNPLSNGFNLQFKEINKVVDGLIKAFNVVTPGIKTQTGHLSGGNIQRLIVGRELGSEKAMVVLASQPTRGIDIAGTEGIRQNLIDYANRGAGVLLISADLDEILSLSDRVMVLYEGEIYNAGKVDNDVRRRIGNLMMGIKEGCAVEE